MIHIETSWKNVLAEYLQSSAFKETSHMARNAYLTTTVFPHPRNVFKAFELTPFDTVRVVILGQDPYHGPGQAMGLSFSVPPGVRIPPSLQNMYKEIESDTQLPSACLPSGDLTPWAKQGVLLLNSVLTVQAHQAASHQNFGWQHMTDEVIKKLSSDKEHIVFILWGSYAQSKQPYIDERKHVVLKAPHPSPLSAHRGFLGCKHFSQTNAYLVEYGYQPIVW